MQLPLIGLLKYCPGCKQFKLAPDFCRNKSTPDGLQKQCRDCIKAYNWRPPIRKPNPDAVRECRVCKQPKSYQQLVKRKRVRDGVDTICLECNKVKVKDYGVEHPEWKSKYDRHHYIENREDIIEYQRAYYRKAKGTLRYIAATRTQWQNRRARKLSAPGRYTKENLLTQCKSQNNLCYWCSQPLMRKHADHYFPLSRGGTNWPDNIVISCPHCNHSKNNKIPFEEWQPPNALSDQLLPKTERRCQPRPA